MGRNFARPQTSTPSYFGQTPNQTVTQVKTPPVVTSQNGGYQAGAALTGDSPMTPVDQNPLTTPIQGGASGFDPSSLTPQLKIRNNMGSSSFDSPRLPFYGSF